MTTDPERLKLGIENLLDDRDNLYRLVATIDWDAQLDAIRAVLGEHRRSADHVSTNIKELEEEARTYRGPYHDHVVDEHVDAMWRATYSDAAISLSAVGMIVPTIETIFARPSMPLARNTSPKASRRPTISGCAGPRSIQHGGTSSGISARMTAASTSFLACRSFVKPPGFLPILALMISTGSSPYSATGTGCSTAASNGRSRSARRSLP